MGYLSNRPGDDIPLDQEVALEQLADLGNPLQHLRVNAAGTGLEYATAYDTELSIGESIIGGTANRVLYENSSNKLAESANFTFDGTNAVIGGTISASNLSGTNTGDQNLTPTSGNFGFWNRTSTTITPLTEDDVLDMTSSIDSSPNITGTIASFTEEIDSYYVSPLYGYGYTYQAFIYGYDDVNGIYSPDYLSTAQVPTTSFYYKVFFNLSITGSNYSKFKVKLVNLDTSDEYWYTSDTDTMIIEGYNSNVTTSDNTVTPTQAYSVDSPIIANGSTFGASASISRDLTVGGDTTLVDLEVTNIDADDVHTEHLNVNQDAMFGGNVNQSRTYTTNGASSNDISTFFDNYVSSDGAGLRYPAAVIGQLSLRGSNPFNGETYGLRGQIPADANVAYNVVGGLFGRAVIRAGASATFNTVKGMEGAVLFQSPYFSSITNIVGLRGTITGSMNNKTVTSAVLIEGDTTGLTGTTGLVNLYGVKIPALTQGTNNWAFYSQGGNVGILADNSKAIFGAGSDASIYYNGTNLIINPKDAGSGFLSVLGNVDLGSNNLDADGMITNDGGVLQVINGSGTNDGILVTGAPANIIMRASANTSYTRFVGEDQGGLIGGFYAIGRSFSDSTRAGRVDFVNFYEGGNGVAFRTKPTGGSEADSLIIGTPTTRDVIIPNDNAKLLFGSGKDVSVTYNGTNTLFTNEVGSGEFQFGGRITHAGTYAGICVHDNSTAQSIPTGATYTKITQFTTDNLSANCTADSANDKITVTKTGVYKVSGSFSFAAGTANVNLIGAAFLGGAEQDCIHFRRKITTANDEGSASFTGFIDVTSANTDLDFRVRHDNGGSVDITVTYGNLNVEYVGTT